MLRVRSLRSTTRTRLHALAEGCASQRYLRLTHHTRYARYIGLCESTRFGTHDSFFDNDTCLGMNNFSGSDRDVGRNEGTTAQVTRPRSPPSAPSPGRGRAVQWRKFLTRQASFSSLVQIRVDMSKATITYITRFGERQVKFKKTAGLTLFAALDSDENGQYAIERVDPSKSGGGGGGGGAKAKKRAGTSTRFSRGSQYKPIGDAVAIWTCTDRSMGMDNNLPQEEIEVSIIRPRTRAPPPPF